METLLGVDESLDAIIDLLTRRGELDDTLILYMGDNGFMCGEHGLIDKHTAYEASMRIPMIARCPALFPPGSTVDAIAATIDVAPTMLAAGRARPARGRGGGEHGTARPRSSRRLADRAALRKFLGAQFPANLDRTRSATIATSTCATAGCGIWTSCTTSTLY